jgi:hypothetical protein
MVSMSNEEDLRTGHESDQQDDVAQSFVSRMHAPEPEKIPGLLPWWSKDLGIGIFTGLSLGVIAFFVFHRSPLEQPTTEKKAPTSQAAPAVDAAAPAPLAKIESPPLPTQDAEPINPLPPPTPAAPEIQKRDFPPASSSAPPRFVRDAYRSLVAKGWKSYKQGNFRAAANTFGRAVHESPHRADGYYGLSLSLFEQGQESVALEVLERGALKSGAGGELWVLAGSIYQWMGKEAMARTAYERYIKENPRGAYVHDVKIILKEKPLPRLYPMEEEVRQAIETENEP